MKRKLLTNNPDEAVKLLFKYLGLKYNQYVGIGIGFIISVCIICIQCTPKVTYEKESQVIIIFQDAVEQTTTNIFMSKSYAPDVGDIAFIDADGSYIQYNPRTIGYDTLSVPAYCGYAELSFMYQVYEKIPFLLEAGDTVLVSYGENLRPRIRSKNSSYNTWLYNLPYEDSRAVNPIGYSNKSVLEIIPFKSAYRYMHDPKSQLDYPELGECFANFYVDLDSLKIVYANYVSDFSQLIDSLETFNIIPTVYAQWFRKIICGTGDNRDDIKRFDSLMHYVTNHDKLIGYPYPDIEIKEIPDRFDYVTTDTTLCDTARKALLKNYINTICSRELSPFSEDIKTKYCDKYYKITGDSSFVYKITELPNILSTNEYTFDLIMESTDGIGINLSELIERNKGKVIYVDFWASWCAPCRAEMPMSLQLQEKYKTRNVVFIYLSLDSDKEIWENAVHKYETESLCGENYIIMNAANSKFLLEIRHSLIPRYLIFDRSGTLANINAPRPSSDKIESVLNSYL